MMLIIALTSRLLIRHVYELFYMMHVLFVIAILITLYFHRPWIETRTSVVVIICAGRFVLDKVTRIIKYATFSHGTTAMIVPPRKWKHPHHFEPESARRQGRVACFPLASLVSKPYSPILAQ
jgi:hypothetical protein